jgi:hypothetical protein
MSETITADGGRTDTKRFDADDTVSATDLIVGDRIDPALVASTMDGLGHTRSPRPDAAPTQLAEATITNGMDDVHSAILVDGETGVMAIASRHDSQSAWSQKEADWKVRAVGDRVAVSDAEVAQDPDGEWDDVDDVASEAEGWPNVVLQDRARGSTDYEDELRLENRSSMIINNPWGAKLYATVELESDE